MKYTMGFSKLIFIKRFTDEFICWYIILVTHLQFFRDTVKDKGLERKQKIKETDESQFIQENCGSDAGGADCHMDLDLRKRRWNDWVKDKKRRKEKIIFNLDGSIVSCLETRSQNFREDTWFWVIIITCESRKKILISSLLILTSELKVVGLTIIFICVCLVKWYCFLLSISPLYLVS